VVLPVLSILYCQCKSGWTLKIKECIFCMGVSTTDITRLYYFLRSKLYIILFFSNYIFFTIHLDKYYVKIHNKKYISVQVWLRPPKNMLLYRSISHSCNSFLLDSCPTNGVLLATKTESSRVILQNWHWKIAISLDVPQYYCATSRSKSRSNLSPLHNTKLGFLYAKIT